jgi:SSS family transporter
MVEWQGRIVIPGGEARPAVRTPRVLTAVPQRTAGKFGRLDWTVIIAYFIVIAGIGIFVSGRMKQTTGDYFLGGRNIPWWAAGLSIFGSKLSALTFIAIPAKAYASNWVFIFNNVMILVVAPIVAYFYLPYFRKLGITSVYEYLQTRFDHRVRLIGSLTFTVFQISRLGVVIYLPALVLSTVTGIDMYLCIGLTTFITTAYSISGGIEAVVWTEVVQVFVLLGGALASLLFMAAHTDGGFQGIFQTAMANDKLRIIHPGWSMAEPVLWVVISGAFLTNLVTYTSDQVVVQRYLTTSTEAEARRSIYTNALMAIPATLIFFSVGTALWVFFRQEPAALDPHGRTDDIFPWYIAQQLPAGLSGLVIAGLFAATMATISSSMHSISTVVTTDFYRLWKPLASDRQRLRFARIVIMVLGLSGSAIAVYLVQINNASIFDQYLKIIGLFGGALAGIFAAGIFFPKTNAPGIITGFLITCVGMYFVQRSDRINFFLYPVFGVIGTILSGLVFSMILKSSNEHDGSSGLSDPSLNK